MAEQFTGIGIPHIAGDRDFSECIKACNELLTTKGHDYTQGAAGDKGRLKNFYTTAEDANMTPYQALYVLMKKHWDAVKTFISKGQVESEPIEGRIYDTINYLLLLYKMVKYEQRQAMEAKHPSADSKDLPPNLSGYTPSYDFPSSPRRG